MSSSFDHQSSSFDPEKGTNISPVRTPSAGFPGYAHDITFEFDESPPSNRFLQWTNKVEHMFGMEARGIRRVKSSEQTPKTTLSFIQIAILWFSINTASQNIMIATVGREIYGLGFVDSVLCSILGAVVGCISVAYTATWGPISGNRTLIFARFSMGWWPVKLCVLLNLVQLCGYSMIGSVISGQILSAVAPKGILSVEVGIVIAAVMTFMISTLGIKTFHHYEKYAWVPQVIVLLILLGTAGPHFDTSSKSIASGMTLVGNRLSFFSICMSSSVTYSSCAADYFVYCDPKLATRAKVFCATFLGLVCSFALCFTIGCGLASGLHSNPIWNAAGSGSGALIVAGFDGLGAFGKLCSVIAALGLVSNMVPPIYCCGIDVQILGRYTAQVPRFIWNALAVVIFTVCALAGKNELSLIFMNFLALMGYWVVLWVSISLQEQLIFRRNKNPKYIWSDWNRQDRLPVGMAAFAAFCVGWVAAILSMRQVYYTGPLARLVGEEGADLGSFLGFGAAGFVYLPLRWWELKAFKR